MATLSRFVRDASGATATEYGLIAAGIAVVITGGVYGIGGKLKTAFQHVSDNFSKEVASEEAGVWFG